MLLKAWHVKGGNKRAVNERGGNGEGAGGQFAFYQAVSFVIDYYTDFYLHHCYHLHLQGVPINNRKSLVVLTLASDVSVTNQHQYKMHAPRMDHKDDQVEMERAQHATSYGTALAKGSNSL